ncbi:hypothetical protein [Niastella sp. OAS944]|uniref:hypothetical protein n=1 Tax=Niastella sp. OAS944 TaxID=2664089 RepID=UPI0034907270|nr:hypothetical protein [Chitinophagaceae bacterium OAS944]
MFYSITIDNRTNWEWQAHFIKDTHNKYILDVFTTDEVLTLAEPITMFLINRQGDLSQRKAIPFAADLVYWADDITYKSFRPSGPGSQVIISEKLKAVLEQFTIPPHKYYPIHMKLHEPDARSNKYHLLHIHSTFITNTNFSKSDYRFRHLKTNEIVKTQHGGFADFEAFNQTRTEYFKENILLEPSVIAHVHDYDVLQGISNTLLVNEQVKNAIEKAGLKGVTINPFKEYEVRL